MSDRLIQVFLANTAVHLEGEKDAPKTLWKVVLRTGTWKLRPGPGGVKLNTPLKIYRDKAPKGHISMSELVKNFDDGAKENVTIPSVHADGTTSDSGFVRRLVIQDVKGEDGSKTKEALLWAECDITDSEVRRKVEEKSIVGVSGGILFDYERTEDAKKYGQILSHVTVTNSPWINGTGGFTDKLPAGVMASEPSDLPFGEVEFDNGDPDPLPHLPVVQLDGPAKTGEPPEPGKATSNVVWKPEQGFRYVQDKVQKTLRRWREQVMAAIPQEQRYTIDWPYYHADDVTLTDESSGTALISCGYGSDADTWVAGFKFDDDREVEIAPFVKWTPAKQEWVAASEDQKTTPKKPPARPASRGPGSKQTTPPAASSRGLGLQDAQAARRARMGLGATSITTGGSMGRISDLLSGVELSDEQREAVRAEEERVARFETDEKTRRERDRTAQVTAYCGTPDGEKKGILDEIGLGDPGVKKYVRNALLSDDGEPAIELSEHLSDGQKTNGVPKTATDLLKGFIDILPKVDGKVSLADQARRLPSDSKPPNEVVDDDKPADAATTKANADALLASFDEQNLGGDLVTMKEA